MKATHPSQLKTFSIVKILKEWRLHCPTFFTILESAAVPPSYSKKRKLEGRAPLLVAGSILMKCRNYRMNALQHIVGIALHQSHAKKKVLECTCFAN
jgi:hypothetical protein